MAIPTDTDQISHLTARSHRTRTIGTPSPANQHHTHDGGHTGSTPSAKIDQMTDQ
jgi:hypothetical protein